MDFAITLKNAVLAFLSTYEKEAIKRIATTLETWDVNFGYNKNGNLTDHKSTITELRDKPVSPVALDKYVDGSNCIIVNRMQAQRPEAIFVAALHGAILAERRAAGAKTEDGKERLYDGTFSENAQYLGLIKVQAQKPVFKDGKAVLDADGKQKMVNIPDSTRRVWFGVLGNSPLEKAAAEFAKANPETPTAYCGTEAKNTIGTILIPVRITKKSGAFAHAIMRFNSYTAAELKMKQGTKTSNEVLDIFEREIADVDQVFDTKNKGYKLLASLCEARKARAAVPEPQPEPEPVKVAAPASKQQHKKAA